VSGADICRYFTDTSADEVVETMGSEKTSGDVFLCPAWMNFKLDVNAVMAAMFPSSGSQLR